MGDEDNKSIKSGEDEMDDDEMVVRTKIFGAECR